MPTPVTGELPVSASVAALAGTAVGDLTIRDLRDLLQVTEASAAARAEAERDEAAGDRARYAQLAADGRVGGGRTIGWYRARRPVRERPERPEPPGRDGPVSLDELRECARVVAWWDFGQVGTAAALYALARRAGMDVSAAARFATEVTP